MRSRNASQTNTQPGFIEVDGRAIFVLEHQPEFLPAEKSVLIVPPFAEEMNRARRMLHLLGHRMAELGFRCTLPDLSATGDSDGELVAVTWETWLADLQAVRERMAEETEVVACVGLRLGGLLAADHARRMPVDKLILWAPFASGRAQLREVLRQRVLVDRFRQHADSRNVDALEQALMNGEPIEAGGYTIGPSLARSLAQVELADCLRNSRTELSILHVGDSRAEHAAEIDRLEDLDQLQASVPGPRFWATLDTAVAPSLLDATERLIDD